ncbi:hypothetical protein MAUB_56720 [Mycolicibacterium aubagnense]|uniref:Uncharacterized protein n=1 Tax=Mycolicibacterium aubagnense TaxID=319707 RepID=A0ABM7IMA8_9MYCO|nr:hypothetical protein MAUB_56720 [Mycolicibacterium aubagnense]
MITFGEKKFFAVPISCSWIIGSVSGPNNGATYAKLPNMPNSKGGRDNADQNAA